MLNKQPSNRKVSAPCSAPTSTRRASRRLFFNLHDGLTCDLEGLGAETGHKNKKQARQYVGLVFISHNQVVKKMGG